MARQTKEKKPFHETVAEKLIEQLKQGTAPWQKPWEPGTGMPFNPTTGNRYKGINVIQLMSQNHDDKRWMTYNQANSLDAQVKKGEKGTPIQYWKFSEEKIKKDKKTGKPILDSEGKAVKIKVRLERPKVFMATVFNAEQIDGLPEIEKKENNWADLDRAEKILQYSGAKINHSDQDRAFYNSFSDEISLPDKTQFPTPDNYYATALHELGHWTGHETRLDRDMGHPFGSDGYAKEELRAEISSMILGEELGIGHDPGQHVAYVKSWIRNLEEDPLEIFRAAADAEKIQEYVLSLEQNIQQDKNNDINLHDDMKDYLERIHGYSVKEEDHDFISNSQKELDAPIVTAMRLAKEKSLPLTDEGFVFNVTQEMSIYNKPDLKQASVIYKGLQQSSDQLENHRYSIRPNDDDIAYLVDIDSKKDKANLVGQVLRDKEQNSKEPIIEDSTVKAFKEAIRGLDSEYLKNSGINTMIELHDKNIEMKNEQIEEILSVSIDRVLKDDPDVDFSHFESFKGDSLKEALSSQGLNTILDVTGKEPEDFYDQAHNALSPVFGLEADDFNHSNAYLERKGLAQAFEITARTLVEGEKLKQQYGQSVADSEDKQQVSESIIKTKGPVPNAPIENQHSKRRSEKKEQEKQQSSESWVIEQIKTNFPAIERMNEEQLEKSIEIIEDMMPVGVVNEFWQRNELPGDDKEFSSKVYSSEILLVSTLANYENINEKEAQAARTKEEVISNNPDSTKEDIAAAKDARKDAELSALLNDTDMKNRIADIENKQDIKLEKTFINVPFKEKEEARDLGAKWDRQKTSWYIPEGMDSKPFDKWSKDGVKPTQKASEEKSTTKGRVYLAVPYEERGAAKTAGAKWEGGSVKSWYAGPKADMDKLKKWLPENVNSQGPAMTPQEEFSDALRSVGCVVDGEHPIMDGEKHRISVDGDKKGQKSGFYIGHLDGKPAGYMINNRSKVEMKWKSKGYTLTPEDKAKMMAEAANKLQARKEQLQEDQEQTAERVSNQTKTLVKPKEPTVYMQNKGIKALPGALTDLEGKKTYLPVIDANEKQWTMQYIQEDGTKRFAKDGKKEGCFHIVGGDMKALEEAPVLIISEGYSTANSLSEGSEQPTVAAFDSGNLIHVAKALHEKFPDKPIIIAGDDDLYEKKVRNINPGVEKGQEAAKAVNGKFMKPVFAPGENTGENKSFTDYNDLAHKSKLGKEGVKRQLRSVMDKVIEKHQDKIQKLEQQQTKKAVRR